MREKLRVLWWKITNPIHKIRIFSRSTNKKERKYKPSRVFAWVGAGVVSIGLVTFAAIFLNTNNETDSYAAGSGVPPNSVNTSWNMSSCSVYNPLYPGLDIGCRVFEGSIVVSDLDELMNMAMTLACSSSGLPSPVQGNTLTGELVLTNVDMRGGTVTYCGTFSTGDPNVQTGSGCVTVEWIFSQPVTESEAIWRDAGEVFEDTLRTLEVNVDGYEIFDGGWREGKAGDASFDINLHGPFYNYESRSPSYDGSCDDYSGKYFCAGNTTTPPVTAGKNIVLIGDGAANTAYNNWSQTDRNFFTRAVVSSTKTWATATSDISSNVDSNTAYLALSLGKSDLPTTIAQGIITEAQWTTRINAAITAAQTRSPNIKIGLMGLYDWSNYVAGNVMWPSGTGTLNYNIQQSITNFTLAIESIAASETNVFTIGWIIGATVNDPSFPTTTYSNDFRDPCTSNGYLPSTSGNCTAGGLNGTGVEVFYDLLYNALNHQTAVVPNPTVEAARQGWGTFGGETFPVSRLRSTRTLTKSLPDAIGSGFANTISFGEESRTYPAGIYYYVTNVNKSNGPNEWVLLEEWNSPYGGSNSESADTNAEQWISYINYGTVSSTSTSYVDSEGKNLDRNDYFTDTITISPYNAKNGPKEGGTVSRYDSSNNLKTINGWSNWPQRSAGDYIPVNVCVTAYGPYQTSQAQKPQNSNLSSEPTPANPTICQYMSPSMNNGVSDFTFTNIGNWETGYYYFVTSIDKSNQLSEIAICMEDDHWSSRFNPQDENEWVWRKFQPFVTSNVYNSTRNDWQPWVDVNEGGAEGEDIIDRVVARASKTLAGAQNGFQWKTKGTENDANGDDNGERYWPKYDTTSGTNAGKYLPVLYKFYICGPFQYPQNEGTTSDMKNPTATNTSNYYQNAYGAQGTACNGNNTLKTIAKYITPNSCSRNPVIKNPDGTYQSPTESGNSMVEYPDGYIENNAMTSRNTCEINFGRTDENGEYYQPGYYYFTSEMIKADQTTFASASLNPGLSIQSQIKNFIMSDWHSTFNPLRTQSLWPSGTLNEIEWAYVQTQPIIKSYAGATKDDRSENENNWTTRLSYRYVVDRDNQYKGLQLSCNEHYDMPTWTDMNNDTDFWDKVPPTTLTCENISDRVYIGMTTTEDVNDTTNVVTDDNEDEKNWPKTNDTQSGVNGSNYEVLKYRVKLYGPFSTASIMTNGTLEPNPSGENQAGKTVTVVPSTNPNLQALVNNSSQPAAESCLLAAKYGPNYDDFPGYDEVNPNNSLNAYYYQNEKTSISEKGYYPAVFTREPDINCASNGSGVLGLNDSSDVPYTTISLKPGIYVSVVETWKVDMDENNIYDNGDTDYRGSNAPDEEEYFSDNGTENGGGSNVDQQTVNSANKRSQISRGDVRDLLANDFHSKWADPYESIFVPPDTDIWTLRGNMDNFLVDWGARYHDQYWTVGWSNWRTQYEDVFGNALPDHNGDESSYQGETNYFAPDRDPDERVGKLKVDLYGAFDMRPDTDECPADKKVATWLVDAEDTDKTGEGTRLENMLPSSGDGWYVYVFNYDGDDRIPALQTKCSDPDEQFHLGEFKPELETQIEIESSDGYAPTVVSDTVKVTGYAEKDSLVKLTLFRRGGRVHNPNVDTEICTVQFKITETVESATYSVSNYMDKDGYVFVSNAPEGTDYDSNRCWADISGHYYWYEEFFNPDGKELMEPRADGPYEWADIEEQPPEVTTNADVSVLVGEPFHDTATVRLPDGNEKTYHLYMRAYGPTTGAPICDTVGKSNLLFESGPHTVKESGTYPSAYTTSATPGYVYWIETLEDAETGEVVAEGYCGKELEMTKVISTPVPGDEWEWTPGAPMAGEIALSAAKIIATTGLLGVGAWQILDKNSWLMSKISK